MQNYKFNLETDPFYANGIQMLAIFTSWIIVTGWLIWLIAFAGGYIEYGINTPYIIEYWRALHILIATTFLDLLIYLIGSIERK